MIRKKTKQLMHLELAHHIPGRIRVRAGALKYLKQVQEEFLTSINQHEYFKDVEYNGVTGSLLIYFDEEQIGSEEVVEVVENHIGTFSIAAYQAEREEKNTLTVNERRLQEESVKDIFKRVAISATALGAFALIKGLRGFGMMGWRRKLLAPPALISIGLSLPIFQSGWDSLKYTKKPNADTLTSTAVLTALLTGRSISALVTILLADVAELMTAYTMENTRKAISDMLNVGVQEVFVVQEDGRLIKTLLSDVEPGDVISIQTGDKISVDGVIVKGEAFVDESPITGEFFPVNKTISDSVFAGTIMKSGNIHVEAEKVGDQTTVARIVHMVESASSRKAQIQTYADKFSTQLIPLNFGLAVIIYAITRNINRALSMMIIDFSCGVRLSTATALSACIHNAARNGVLIKGGNYVEALAEADALVLDKTGTITEGRPKVMSIYPIGDYSAKDLLQMAGAAEEDSSHPLAQAILNYIKKKGYAIPDHGMVKVVTGRGVTTTVDGERIYVGNRKYMHEQGIDTEILKEEMKSLEKKGEIMIFIGKESELVGILGIHDALKENMKKALNRLRNLGFDDVRLLTGDIAFQAEKMAKRMHMDDFGAELMPEDKVKTVLNMQAAGSNVVMIGDGINDAPALAYADVGIAIGNTRTDVAIESSNVTITNDDPLLIPSAIQLSRQTMGTIRNNFGMVVGINALGIILSAMGWLPVVWGSVLHNSSTILVVMNSGRLLLQDFERRTF